ncbi:MarR family winged helix-turn-helix transcriptional regulator [Paenibacillus abyssi]|uniref:HTH marR-type domain-containing protein n=1 Tax=Paenibacillus abyssi TaxID=1340531 RepID=A0A917G2M4_9BACL|nr:MarR family transcriptional regulator [Paenibacillus abyssi]GGG19644.1 hypothetical protein GCM10010916_40580 [Paenibacillus abyssi]
MEENKGSTPQYRDDMIRLEEAFRLLRKQLLAEWGKENIASLGLTQARVLLILSEAGPQKVSVLADMLFITSGAVTGMADSLIRLGLIRRERGESDRRVVMLEITEAGQQHVKAIKEKRIAIMERITTGLTDQEIHDLTGLLMKIVDSSH